MDLYVVTGGSKGLGLALVEKVLSEGHMCLSISRSGNSELKTKYSASQFLEIKFDLTKKFSLFAKKFDQTLKKINLKKIENIFIINNAAQIQPVAEVGQLNPAEIEKHYYLNITFPVLFTNHFLAKKLKIKGLQTFVQISSGAARFAITNWSIYCSGKAAIEMFNDVMQIQLQKNNKIKAITYSPGIIDTGMQSVIRSFKSKDFPEVQRFKDYKKSNELKSPEFVAESLYQLIQNPNKLTDKTYSL